MTTALALAIAAAVALPLVSLPARADSSLVFEPNTAVWAAETLRSVQEAPYNPGNFFAQVPREAEALETRPDWRLHGESWKLVARPRLLLTRDTTSVNGATSARTLALLRWSEAFATWNTSPVFSVDYGLQNFSWGPAESASPSNRIIRDTVQVKDLLYLVYGHHLVRLTYAPGPSWSEVFLFEPTGNGQGEPEPGVAHTLKGALKSELSWSGGADFAGLVAGWRDTSGWWAGEYLNLELVDGLYAYTDASEQAGSLAYYPVQSAAGLVSYAQNHRFDANVSSFVVSGLRYAFENGNDWRFEWIHQGLGYTTTELARARAALASPNPFQLAALTAQAPMVAESGLDFPARDYLYTSIYFPNSFGFRDWNLYVRGLESLADHSVAAYGSSENRLGEHGTLLAGLSATFGPAGAELKGVVDFAATLAYRHAW